MRYFADLYRNQVGSRPNTKVNGVNQAYLEYLIGSCCDRGCKHFTQKLTNQKNNVSKHDGFLLCPFAIYKSEMYKQTTIGLVLEKVGFI